MAVSASRPYRRRTFFVKHWFQTGFALYPVLFLCVFLLGGALYLHRDLRETLEFQLYQPHARLDNPWDVVGPAVLRVAAAGGGAFLLALAAWGWRRFARLHRDLDALSTWLGRVARDPAGEPLPPIAEPEVRGLGLDLERAARGFEAWDREVAARVGSLFSAAEGVRTVGPGELSAQVAPVRDAWRSLSAELSRMRVEEDLS